MKKVLKSVLMLSIASLAILSSCKKEDENATVTDVKVTVTSTPSSPLQGGIVTLTVVCTGNTDNNLKSISVSRSGGSLDSKVVLSKSLTGTSSTQTIVDTLGSGTFTYNVAVTGESGSAATEIHTITTREPYGTLETLPVPIDLSGQTQDSSQSYFMRLTSPFTPFDRARATFAANKANIDMCFYYGNANKATLASPDDAAFMQTVYTYITWTGAKKTLFSTTTLTAAKYDEIEASDSDSAIVEMAKTTTTWAAAATKLKADDIILFKTAEGKKGLIKVQNLLGTDASTATLSVKVISQK